MNRKLKRVETALIGLAAVLVLALSLAVGMQPDTALIIAIAPLVLFEIAVAVRCTLQPRVLHRPPSPLADAHQAVVERLEDAYAANPPSDEEWAAIMRKVTGGARLNDATGETEPPCCG